jgi:hypothetical protein
MPARVAYRRQHLARRARNRLAGGESAVVCGVDYAIQIAARLCPRIWKSRAGGWLAVPVGRAVFPRFVLNGPSSMIIFNDPVQSAVFDAQSSSLTHTFGY